MTELRLGRRIEHDERSRRFAFQTVDVPVKSIKWAHYPRPLDQGDLGACTGFAMTQWLNCYPAHKPRTPYGDADLAKSIYSRATQLDPWDGEWPDNDTGSSGLAACKAARERSLINSYRWIFEGVDELKIALQTTPVMAGTMWLDNMFEPISGYLNVTGREVGGHEYLIIGWNQPSRYFTMLNSWGPFWGKIGTARIREVDMIMLLRNRGDLVVPQL